MSIRCPHCSSEMNEYEVNNLWCTNCNKKFSSKAELMSQNESLNVNLPDTILMTNGFDFEGYSIKKYLGLITNEAVIGTGLKSELSVAINDAFGSESRTFKSKVSQVKKEALNRLVEDARSVGANAIIGVSFGMFNLQNNMIIANVMGTAAIVEENICDDIARSI